MIRLRKVSLWIGGCTIGATAVLLILAAILPLPPVKPFSPVVEDRNGQFLHAYLADDGIWRLRTSPDEIPLKLKRILLKKEDRYFYYHPGINPFALARALMTNVTTGKRISGASTLTMQVARMLEPKERTYGNKLVEMFRSVQLELRYSKDEILEMYLSMVPLGGNIEGLKSAALLYYQTPPERLNIAQLFDLILIPNDPNDLRPDRFPQRLLAERIRRAKPFLREGMFSRQDSIILWQSSAAASRSALPMYAPHFCLRLKDGVVPKRAWEQKHGIVRSSLDLRVQRTVEMLLSKDLLLWKQCGVQNGAALVINNKTKEILAYAGSEDFDNVTAHGQVDAVKALRSPGSTLKPFLFAMDMDRGVLTPKMRLLDVPYDAEGFLAENYDGKYSGLVAADDALRRSLNVPMIRLLREAGTEQFFTCLRNAGFVSLIRQKERLGLSLILGGCGVTLEELTAAYCTFPSGGMYSPLRYLTSGPVDDKEVSVCSSSAAYMVTDILSAMDRPDLPNNFESSLNLPKVAFKTGTSYGRRDAWSIGYTAEYTVGVWIGNVDQRGNPELTGGRAAAPILIDILNAISTKHEKSILAEPSDVQIREVCATSGLLATKFCPRTIDDLYSVRRTQNRYCTIHSECLVSPDGKTAYCPSCLGRAAYRIRMYEDYPPELLNFWASAGKQLPAVPRHNPLCTQVASGEGPKILSPSDQMTYYLAEQDRTLILQATSAAGIREHIWYVDDHYLMRQPSNKKLFIPIGNGTHTITCMDERGRASSVKVLIKVAM